MTVYVVDTNLISDIAAPTPKANVLNNMTAHRQDTVCLCEAVDYEVRRGYLRIGATTRLQAYERVIKPQFQWVQLAETDWQQAAHFWADAAKRGKALSDVDLLVAAVAHRLGAIVVSADADFDQIGIKRENWRDR